MSKAPLLLRSSPALGTGSYGALPVGSFGSSPGDSERENGESSHRSLDQILQKSNSKGKKPLRHARSSVRRRSGPHTGLAHLRSDLTKSDTALGRTHFRKRSKSLSSGSSDDALDKLVDGAIDGHQEAGLEPRFNASIAPATAEAIAPPFEGLGSSSCSSKLDTEDDVDASSNDHEYIDKSPTEDEDPPDNSPYAAVRAAVRPVDNISLSINTPRMWTLSILFAILGSSTNLFFSLRYPSVSITPVIALLLSHPLGRIWDEIFKCSSDPEEIFVNGSLIVRKSSGDSDFGNGHSPEFSNGDGTSNHIDATMHKPTKPDGRLRSLRLWLAQGTWNEKEHSCVYIASNVSFGFAFATDVIVEQSKFYNQELSIVYQILLTISTQVLGYAMAGVTRNFLVRPSGMIWPSTLISTSMFSTLHKQENKPANGWTISRSKFFLYVFAGSVAFYFLPGLLMPALSYFNVITWFAPKNVVVANFFGVASGLGLFPLTFDWAQIAYIGSPLVVPFWAALNIVAGLVVVMWILAPILYYTNVMFSSYMPILSAVVFDNTGKPYDVSKILTSDFRFDVEAYKRYSRVWLPITYVLSYALQFAALTALVSHTICWHSRDIIKQWKRSWKEIRQRSKLETPTSDSNRDEEFTPLVRQQSRSSAYGTVSEPGLDDLMAVEDVHNRLMRRYNDVPVWWYLLTGISMAGIGMFLVEYYDVYLPWYGLLLALGICAALFIPIGIVMAITSQQSSLYLICQLICGVVFPGRPVANMVFVTYGYITSTQGLKFSSDLKLGHYMKLPPRLLFTLQLTATIISSLTQIGVLNWMLENIPGICTADAINGFNCPIARVHFNGSILWGVVGPQRFFGPEAPYRHLVWAFLVGAISPIFVYILGRRHKKSIWRKVNLPVMFGSLSWIPPATGLNFSVWALVCWVFNSVILKRRPEWWGKYNMTLSAALDSGLAVGVVVIFFGIVYPGWMGEFKWWGTEVFKEGCDWQACAYREVPEGGHFGPDRW